MESPCDLDMTSFPVIFLFSIAIDVKYFLLKDGRPTVHNDTGIILL